MGCCVSSFEEKSEFAPFWDKAVEKMKWCVLFLDALYVLSEIHLAAW